MGKWHSEFLAATKSDRDKAVWHYLRERQRCGGCGTLREEWDPAEGGSVHAYHVDEHFCVGCQILAPARKKLSGENAPEGLHVSLVPAQR